MYIYLHTQHIYIYIYIYIFIYTHTHICICTHTYMHGSVSLYSRGESDAHHLFLYQLCLSQTDMIKLIAFELAAKFSRRAKNPVQPHLCNAKNAIQTAQNGVFPSVAIFAGQLKRNQLYNCFNVRQENVVVVLLVAPDCNCINVRHPSRQEAVVVVVLVAPVVAPVAPGWYSACHIPP